MEFSQKPKKTLCSFVYFFLCGQQSLDFQNQLTTKKEEHEATRRNISKASKLSDYLVYTVLNPCNQ